MSVQNHVESRYTWESFCAELNYAFFNILHDHLKLREISNFIILYRNLKISFSNTPFYNVINGT